MFLLFLGGSVPGAEDRPHGSLRQLAIHPSSGYHRNSSIAGGRDVLPERRETRRYHLLYYLRVFDDETDAFFGHLFDITTGGIRVVSEWPLPVPKRYRLWMELPRDEGGRQRLSLQVESLWTQQDEADPCFHNTGFRLVDLDHSVREQLTAVVAEMKALGGAPG